MRKNSPACLIVARFIASGFGSGFAPKAPGTAGSFVGLLIGIPLYIWSPLALALGVCIATLAGLAAIHAATNLPFRAPAKSAHDDPGWIVIDEIAGQMLALFGLHHLTPIGIALAFALFRLFDIAKPFPVGWADRQGGSAGIMADDLLAGALAAFLMYGV